MVGFSSGYVRCEPVILPFLERRQSPQTIIPAGSFGTSVSVSCSPGYKAIAPFWSASFGPDGHGALIKTHQPNSTGTGWFYSVANLTSFNRTFFGGVICGLA